MAHRSWAARSIAEIGGAPARLTRPPRDPWPFVGVGRDRSGLAYFAPTPRHTRQTGTTEDRRPHGRTLSSRRVLALDGPDRLTRSTAPATPSLRAGRPSARPRVSPLPPAANTHRRRAPARCSGREEARLLQVHQERRPEGVSQSIDPPGLALSILALAVAFGGLAVNPARAAAAAIKVVIVVGPVGSSTAKYVKSAKSYAAARPLLRRLRQGGLQPECDVGQGEGRCQGREHLHLPRPRQRVSQPVWRLLRRSARRHRASTRRPATGNRTPSTTARRSSRPPRPGAELRRDPQPPVLRLGQFRVGPRPTRPRPPR